MLQTTHWNFNPTDCFIVVFLKEVNTLVVYTAKAFIRACDIQVNT